MIELFKEEKEKVSNKNITEQLDKDIILEIIENILEEIKDLVTFLK